MVKNTDEEKEEEEEKKDPIGSVIDFLEYFNNSFNPSNYWKERYEYKQEQKRKRNIKLKRIGMYFLISLLILMIYFVIAAIILQFIQINHLVDIIFSSLFGIVLIGDIIFIIYLMKNKKIKDEDLF